MKNIFFLLFIFSISTYTNAQINIGQKIKEKVKQRADQKVDKSIDQGLDSVEASGKKSKKEKTKIENEEGTETKIKTKSESETQQVSVVTDVSLISYSKFDFVPGEKTIFFDDFSQDNIGDFPVKWNTNGKGEVVTNSKYPGKWLKMRNATTYLPEISSNKFPENYTIEYDMIATGEDRTGTFNLELTSLPNKQQVPGAGDNPGPGLYLTTQMNPSRSNSLFNPNYSN